MDPESPGGAQKGTHPLMNLNLDIIARVIFTIDRENACPGGFNTVCMNFEEVLLRGKESESRAKSVGTLGLGGICIDSQCLTNIGHPEELPPFHPVNSSPKPFLGPRRLSNHRWVVPTATEVGL
jgi:hypothetical protein